jgi:hypothetical protein
MNAKNRSGIGAEVWLATDALGWLHVLAAPHLYRMLQHGVDTAHLMRMMDFWIAYVDGDARDKTAASTPAPHEERRAMARALRERIAAWVPPELPVELTEAARALLRAEGREPKRGWDNFIPDLEEGGTLDDTLMSAERVDAFLRAFAEEPKGPQWTHEKILNDMERGRYDNIVTYYDRDNPRVAEITNAQAFSLWLMVLSRPQLYDRLKRKPEREHLMLLIDDYLPFARTRPEDAQAKGYEPKRKDPELHERLALRLRELLGTWIPPALSPQIVSAARALSVAESYLGHKMTFDDEWDDKEIAMLEADLVWPAQVADRLKS